MTIQFLVLFIKNPIPYPIAKYSSALRMYAKFEFHINLKGIIKKYNNPKRSNELVTSNSPRTIKKTTT